MITTRVSAKAVMKSKNNFWLVYKGHGESLGRAGGSVRC